MLEKVYFLIISIFIISSCKETELQAVHEVYTNDFESGNLDNIINGEISIYRNDNVLGFFNKGEVIITLGDLIKHDFVEISFTLNIHGSWDGNLVGEPEQAVGPDLWGISVDDWVTGADISKQERTFVTTFSNSPCNPSFCLMQSFPLSFPSVFNPKAGSNEINLPVSCDTPTGGLTTQYRINKVFRHSGKLMKIRFFDELKQGNVSDEFCDENWSIDNLSVSLITTN